MHEPGGRLGHAAADRAARDVGLDHQPVQLGPPGGRDGIARHPARRRAGDPVLQRHRLRHRAVQHGQPFGRAGRRVADDHRLFHVGGDGQHGAGIAQAPQNAASLASQLGGVGVGSTLEIVLHRHVMSLLRHDGPMATEGKAANPAQGLVHQHIVPEGFQTSDLAQHGRGMAPPGPCQRTDRQARLGVGEIAYGSRWNPDRDRSGS